MGLTDAERAEFIVLSEATYDAALWDEDDLPILRKAKRQFEEEQARERGEIPADEQSTTAEEDDVSTGADYPD
jgi:hypothetical protein